MHVEASVKVKAHFVIHVIVQKAFNVQPPALLENTDTLQTGFEMITGQIRVKISCGG